MKKITLCISDIQKSVAFELTAMELRKIGIETEYILINCESGILKSFLIENSFKVHSFENNRLINSISLIWKVRKLLKKNGTDVIHCHLAQANWIGLWAAKLAGVPTRIYTRHSGEAFYLTKKEKYIDRIQNKLATKIISISENITDLLIKQKVNPAKITLIHHGFDLERFSHPNMDEVKRIRTQYNSNSASPTIGVIARWMEWKGIHTIIDAFKEVIKTHPTAKLLLFGATNNTEYSDKIKSQLKSVPSENLEIITFENNVFDLYQLFDIYVHVPVNKTCEAFGQTYVEALASGIPSVFTLSGVAREFIHHNENAFVVDFENSTELSAGILTILEKPEYRKKLIENGKQSVQKQFSFDSYLKKITQLYS